MFCFLATSNTKVCRQDVKTNLVNVLDVILLNLQSPQIRVHPDDVWMQGFTWLGKVFFEVCLVFGTSSSAGIYDAVAKVVLYVAAALASFPLHLCIQHLDDVCACSPEGSNAVDSFYSSYLNTCKQLNIQLAKPTDPDKCFSPRTDGQVLGARRSCPSSCS